MSIEFNDQQLHALYDIENWWSNQNEQVYNLSGAAGTGKAHPITISIPTPDGSRQLGDLNVGDYVFNRLGKPVKILGIYDYENLDVYRVTFEDGRYVDCNDEHLWTIYDENDKMNTLTLKEINNIFTSSYDVYIPLCEQVDCFDSKQFALFYNVLGNEKSYYIKTGYIFIYLSELFKNTCPEKISELIYSLGLSASFDETFVKIPINSRILRYAKGLPLFNKIREYMRGYVDEKVDKLKIISINKRYIKSDMRCIYVDDPEHLYLVGDYIVTHNTTLIRYFIDRIGLELSEVAFVAYMGKAAMQMARTGLPARTIHSLIYTYQKILDLDENGKIQVDNNGRQKMKYVFVKREQIDPNIQLIVLDEASMVNKEIAEDLLSYNIPLIALGDLNQLPPVFGKPYFLENPNYILTQVMRQEEHNPIVWLAHRVLDNRSLPIGVYGKSSVIPRADLTDFVLSRSDIVLTCTNRLRYEINQLFREEIKKLSRLDLPNEGEKIICRRNNWSRSIAGSIYLTNGLAGTIEYVDTSSFDGKSIKIDFKPDFLNKKFKNIALDYKRLFSSPSSDLNFDKFSFTRDQFEFAYAITTHASQGSTYQNVVFLNERMTFDKETYKKLQYTAITRASESVTVVL